MRVNAALKQKIVAIVASLAGIVCALLPQTSLSRPAGNPFAALDQVALFADLPGTVAERAIRGYPETYDSERFDLHGIPDPATSVSGRMRDGTWILISSFGSRGLVYRWSGTHAEPAGVIASPEQAGLRVSVVHGLIVQRFHVYSPTADCAAGAELIRTFDLLGGTLHELASRTEPAHFAVVVTSPLPASPLDDEVFAQALADRTPGLYRMCFHGHTDLFLGNGPLRYYVGVGIDLYGRPDGGESTIHFESDGVALMAVPFSSGGSGGVFTAGIYRIVARHPVLVRTLRSPGGRMILRLRSGDLEMVSPPIGESYCCPSYMEVRRFHYDAPTGMMRTSRSYRFATGYIGPKASSPDAKATPIPPLAPPFETVDVAALFAALPGNVLVRAGEPPVYSSKTFDLYGAADPAAATVGTLSDGTHVLVSPLDNRADVMLYRWTPHQIVPIGSLIGPGYERETVAIENGRIVQRYKIAGRATGCSDTIATVTYDVRAGALREIGRTARPAASGRSRDASATGNGCSAHP